MIKVKGQCEGGQPMYGAIVDMTALHQNFEENAVPKSLLDDQVPEYLDFLAARRKLLAAKLKDYYFML